MSSKSKKRKKPKGIDILSADTTINVLENELKHFKKIYDDRFTETNCPACNGAMPILKKHLETLEGAIHIMQLYGEHPEAAARLLIASHALYYDAIRNISFITMETAENVHQALHPCPHQVEGTCDLVCNSHGDQKPPEKKQNTQN